MAGKELRADPEELTRLAGHVLAAADGIGDALAASRGPVMVPLTAFGNSEAGPDLHGLYDSALAQGGRTTERLLEVLEGDVDRLYRVAFAYQQLDEENADLIGRVPSAGARWQ